MLFKITVMNLEDGYEYHFQVFAISHSDYQSASDKVAIHAASGSATTISLIIFIIILLVCGAAAGGYYAKKRYWKRIEEDEEKVSTK